jgi:hypothetical protein
LDRSVAVLQFCIDIEDVDVLKVLYVLDRSVAVLQFHIDIEDDVLKMLQVLDISVVQIRALSDDELHHSVAVKVLVDCC